MPKNASDINQYDNNISPNIPVHSQPRRSARLQSDAPNKKRKINQQPYREFSCSETAHHLDCKSTVIESLKSTLGVTPASLSLCKGHNLVTDTKDSNSIYATTPSAIVIPLNVPSSVCLSSVDKNNPLQHAGIGGQDRFSYFPALNNSSHGPTDHQNLNHQYIAAYGSEYYRQLFEKEKRQYSSKMIIPQKASKPITSTNLLICAHSSRMRTRSFSKEVILFDDESVHHHFGTSNVIRLDNKAKSSIARKVKRNSNIPSYMKKQVHLRISMRAKLIGWIMDVAAEFKLNHATVPLAVSLLDRSLEFSVTKVSEFQCLGCACLLIACKFEEVRSPSAADISFLTDSACNVADINLMESNITRALQFRVHLITPYHFADYYIQTSTAGIDYTRKHDKIRESALFESIVLFLLDLSLLKFELVDQKGSLTAAAATYLAKIAVGMKDNNGIFWNKEIEHCTGYALRELGTSTII